jgi:hypothetical protein
VRQLDDIDTAGDDVGRHQNTGAPDLNFPRAVCRARLRLVCVDHPQAIPRRAAGCSVSLFAPMFCPRKRRAPTQYSLSSAMCQSFALFPLLT